MHCPCILPSRISIILDILFWNYMKILDFIRRKCINKPNSLQFKFLEAERANVITTKSWLADKLQNNFNISQEFSCVLINYWFGPSINSNYNWKFPWKWVLIPYENVATAWAIDPIVFLKNKQTNMCIQYHGAFSKSATKEMCDGLPDLPDVKRILLMLWKRKRKQNSKLLERKMHWVCALINIVLLLYSSLWVDDIANGY